MLASQAAKQGKVYKVREVTVFCSRTKVMKDEGKVQHIFTQASNNRHAGSPSLQGRHLRLLECTSDNTETHIIQNHLLQIAARVTINRVSL